MSELRVQRTPRFDHNLDIKLTTGRQLINKFDIDYSRETTAIYIGKPEYSKKMLEYNRRAGWCD